ncbi:MAG: 50S ribosomal protein L5 [Rhodothermia bacterium]|nr:MAG: 50S ribosomal protein L5 [Rhodothermia bacterium]
MKGYVPRLITQYADEIVPALMKEFSYSNVMQVPKLAKISVNKGVGEASESKKFVDDAVEELRTITGQQPIVRNARHSVSNFKLRQGMPIGASVTLRGETMFEFLDRLITLTLPRVRDFRGIPDKSFDGRGNYSLGIKEQIVFPEIDVDKIGRISGLDITFVTTATTDEEALALLKAFGLPFERRDN